MKRWLVVGSVALVLGGCCTDWEGEGAPVEAADPGSADASAGAVGGEAEVDAQRASEVSGGEVGGEGAGGVVGARSTRGDRGGDEAPEGLVSEDRHSEPGAEIGEAGEQGGEEAVGADFKRLKVVASYTARLGRLDHYNERRERLEEAAAIVVQDRVNYHKRLGRDAEDQGDPLYHDRRARVELTGLVRAYLADKPPIAARILRGKPVVRVIVSESRIGKRVARVDILRP